MDNLNLEELTAYKNAWEDKIQAMDMEICKLEFKVESVKKDLQEKKDARQREKVVLAYIETCIIRQKQRNSSKDRDEQFMDKIRNNEDADIYDIDPKGIGVSVAPVSGGRPYILVKKDRERPRIPIMRPRVFDERG